MQQSGTSASMPVASLLRLLTVAAAAGMAGTIYLPWFTGGQRELSLYDVTFDDRQLPYTYIGFMLAALAGVVFASLAGGASGRNEAGWARARGAFFGAALMPAANFFFEDKITGIEPLKLGDGLWVCVAAAAIGIALSSISILASDLDDGAAPATHAAGVFSGFAWGMIVTLYGLVLLEVVRQTSSGFLGLSASSKKEAYEMVLSQTATVAVAGAIPTLLWIMKLGARPGEFSNAYGRSSSAAAARPISAVASPAPPAPRPRTSVVAAETKFCYECGARNRRTGRFCEACGASLDAPRAASERSQAPAAQRAGSESAASDSRPEPIGVAPTPGAEPSAIDSPPAVPPPSKPPSAEPIEERLPDALPIISGGGASTAGDAPASADESATRQTTRPLAGCTVRARYNGVVVWSEVQRRDRELERVSAGAEMTVVGEVGAYLEVELLSGQRGFVAAAAVARS